MASLTQDEERQVQRDTRSLSALKQTRLKPLPNLDTTVLTIGQADTVPISGTHQLEAANQGRKT